MKAASFWKAVAVKNNRNRGQSSLVVDEKEEEEEDEEEEEEEEEVGNHGEKMIDTGENFGAKQTTTILIYKGVGKEENQEVKEESKEVMKELKRTRRKLQEK